MVAPFPFPGFRGVGMELAVDESLSSRERHRGKVFPPPQEKHRAMLQYRYHSTVEEGVQTLLADRAPEVPAA